MKTQTTVHNITPTDLKKEIVADIKKELQQITKNFQRQTQDELITRQELCQILGISLPTELEYRKKGVFIAYRLGRKIRYKRSEVYNSLQQIKSKKL